MAVFRATPARWHLSYQGKEDRDALGGCRHSFSRETEVPAAEEGHPLSMQLLSSVPTA